MSFVFVRAVLILPIAHFAFEHYLLLVHCPSLYRNCLFEDSAIFAPDPDLALLFQVPLANQINKFILSITLPYIHPKVIRKDFRKNFLLTVLTISGEMWTFKGFLYYYAHR